MRFDGVVSQLEMRLQGETAFVLKLELCDQHRIPNAAPILQIRDRRVSELAARLATIRGSTKTHAALEHEL